MNATTASSERDDDGCEMTKTKRRTTPMYRSIHRIPPVSRALQRISKPHNETRRRIRIRIRARTCSRIKFFFSDSPIPSLVSSSFCRDLTVDFSRSAPRRMVGKYAMMSLSSRSILAVVRFDSFVRSVVEEWGPAARGRTRRAFVYKPDLVISRLCGIVRCFVM